MSVRYCRVQGKQQFDSPKDAQFALKRLGGDGMIYQCNYCNHWHVTHMSYLQHRRNADKSRHFEKCIGRKIEDRSIIWRMVSRLVYSCIYSQQFKNRLKPHKHGKTSKPRGICQENDRKVPQ